MNGILLAFLKECKTVSETEIKKSFEFMHIFPKIIVYYAV
jgi:hypothetical protein